VFQEIMASNPQQLSDACILLGRAGMLIGSVAAPVAFTMFYPFPVKASKKDTFIEMTQYGTSLMMLSWSGCIVGGMAGYTAGNMWDVLGRFTLFPMTVGTITLVFMSLTQLLAAT